MLPVASPISIDPLDQLFFDTLVPQDHYLRKVAAVVDFECFRPTLNQCYDSIMGRPPVDPVRMLKIHFLSFHYNLSDRLVMLRAQTDLAFRWFLDFGRTDSIPNHTNGTHFRNRLGEKKFQEVFQGVVTQAREHGLVQDRLRLKDATHILANAAEVTPLTLAAQVRERLLNAAKPLFPEWAAQQQNRLETLRSTTEELPDKERLTARVEFLRTMVQELGPMYQELPALKEGDSQQGQRERLERALAVTAKLLEDQADPKAQDRLVNGVEEEARNGLHGSYFLGYMLDIAIDPTHGIVTGMNVLPANGIGGVEAADAVTLIRQEETAQGNKVAEISMDGAGYNGPVLRELTDPAGLNLEVTVPPPEKPKRVTFGPERFSLTVIETESGEAKGEVTCPNGKTTQQREKKDTGYRYIFKGSQCAGCPLREECLENPQSTKGRKVMKNDYEAEYKRVQEKAKTPEYQATRREHPKVERKLGEMAVHHDLRHARYRGKRKTLIQGLLTGIVVNIKVMVNRLTKKMLDQTSRLPVRAEMTMV